MTEINFNQDWTFQKLTDSSMEQIQNYNDIPYDSKRDLNIQLPHTWYEDGNSYHGTVLYRKNFLLHRKNDERVFIHFEAADRWCRVFVNQHYVGEHKGGYSAFTFEITSLVQEENEICVLLDNRSFDEISPLAGDFTVFGGLYRNVSLFITEKTCFDRTYYGTQGITVLASVEETGSGVLSVNSHVLCRQDESEPSIRYLIYDQSGTFLQQCEGKINGQTKIFLEAPHLWEGMEDPCLYHIRAELMLDGHICDTAELPFGFRSVRLDPERGFFLNDHHKKLHGVAKHQDFGSQYNATTDQACEQDMEILREIGANSVRLSHYQHPGRMYDLCDQNGLVVWAEIPMLRLLNADPVLENAKLQLQELILQNMHHPSICFWGVQNEIAMFGEDESMYQCVKELHSLVKALDGTRLSGCANLYCVPDDSALNQITDATGYNIYYGWYYGSMEDNAVFVDRFHQANPNVALGITEYGVDCNVNYHSENPQVKDYTEEYQALYHEVAYSAFSSRDYIWGTYVWNLFDFSSEIRDEGGVKYKNCKGLVTADRKTKKDAFYYYKAQWSKEPFVSITGRRFVVRTSASTDIKVYSNLREVHVKMNGKTYTAQSDTGVFLFQNLPLSMGENKVQAQGMADGSICTDEILLIRQEEPEKSYIFVDEQPGVNVKNWFTDLLEEEKVFPKGKVSIRDTADEILSNPEAMAIIDDYLPVLGEGLRSRGGAMSLEKILGYMKKQISDEQGRELNRRLTTLDQQD
jgi:beta-galactosidase